MNLIQSLEQRTASIAVVGMGRVGLPLGVAFASAGLRVLGVDPDEERRQAIELGKMPFLEPGCEELLLKAVSSGRLTVHAEAGEAIPAADVIVLCVGTPLAADLRPDLVQLRAALADLAPHLRAGQMLVLRSTVSPGTLTKVVMRVLAEYAPAAAGGMLFAVCPERIAEGKAMEELRVLPEIVGAVGEESAEAAAALFRTLDSSKKIHITDPASAELAKLFTNVYRYVNFALANEFAVLGEHYGVDVHRVLDMVNADYPRARVPKPGPAGGPCLSKDGYFLVEELTLPDFVLLAWKLNDTIPAHVVRRLTSRLTGEGIDLLGAPVAVLGQSFKRDSDDIRQSPAVRVADILRREGAEVRTHDPYLPGTTLDDALSGAKAFVLATNHSHYETLDPAEMAKLMDPPRVGIDCWGMIDRNRFAEAGIVVMTFGAGDAA